MISKWRIIDDEVERILWIFHWKLNVQGKRTDLLPNGKRLPTWLEWIKAKSISPHTPLRRFRKRGWLPEQEQIQAPPLPTSKYNVIYADPPWPISTSVWDKWEEPIDKKYPLMTIDDIQALPVGELSHENTHLFLWTTLTFLPDAIRLIEAWNFKYHVCLTWDKGRGFTLFGYYRNSELLIHSYRGKMLAEWEGEAFHTSFNEPGTKHSQKPSLVYSFLESRYQQPRIELFAREKREGWDSWGNEV